MNRGLLCFLLAAVIALSTINVSTGKTAVFQEAVSVFCYMEGGTGSGEIYFMAGKRLLKVDYQNPRKETGPKGANGYQYGAIWRVRYHAERLSPEDAAERGEKYSLVLDSMAFTGRFDDHVKPATEFVYRHYGLLAHGDYRRAYDNLGSDLHANQSYEAFVQGFRDAKFAPLYPEQVGPNLMTQYPIPNYGFKVIGRFLKKVIVLVNEHTFIETSGKYYRFDVTFINGSRQIDHIRSITYEEFEAA